MGEERTHEVAGTVFCGTRLPAEPPGNPKPHRQPRFALPSAVVGVGFADSCDRQTQGPSSHGRQLSPGQLASSGCGELPSAGRGPAHSLRSDGRKCVWGAVGASGPAGPRGSRARRGRAGVWEDAVLPTRMCGATPPKRFRGSSADSRKGVKFGFWCLWLSRFLPPEPLLLCLQTALFGACRGPRGVRRGPRRPLAQRRGHRGRRCHHRRHWLAPRPLDSHAITRWVP